MGSDAVSVMELLSHTCLLLEVGPAGETTVQLSLLPSTEEEMWSKSPRKPWESIQNKTLKKAMCAGAHVYRNAKFSLHLFVYYANTNFCTQTPTTFNFVSVITHKTNKMLKDFDIN